MLSPSPIFFKSATAFRKWLKKNHEKEKEILVGYYRVSTGKPSMNWSESVDQALCFGWIDGIRRSIDEESYYNRFTPRRPGSNWSNINIKKVESLMAQGLMQPAGIEAFNKRRKPEAGAYSYENIPKELTKPFEKKFRANKKAWKFFQGCPPSYKKTAIKWVMSAKQEATRLSRLGRLIASSEEGKR